MATLSETLMQAVRHHQSGNLRQAEQLYRQILQVEPRHTDALHLLGVAAHHAGRHQEAIEHIRRAIGLDANQPVFHSNLGLVHGALGNSAQALACYDEALRLNPRYAQAHNNRGVELYRQGRLGEAEAAYGKALQLKPDYAEVYNNLGAVQHAQGRLEEASRCFWEALRLSPGNPGAHNNLGAVRQAQGRLDEAAACYREALRLNPEFAEGHNNLGAVLKAQRKYDEVAVCYQTALRLKPDYAAAHSNLGTLLQEQGDFTGALASYERALALAPTDGLRIKAALTLPVIHETKEEMFRQRQRIEANVARLLGEKLTVADPARDVGITAFELAYQGLNDRDLQAAIASLYAQAAPSLNYVAPHCQPAAAGRSPGRPLRVGFLSRFFYDHTIGRLNVGLVSTLARPDFRVIVFRFAGRENDGTTRQLQDGADAVITLPGHLALARQAVAEQRLDVLFYPDIGMDPFTYFLAFSRLAPVQCVTWGHPVTTGIPAIDYFISSELLEAAGAEEHYTETLVRLKNLAVYYYRPALRSALKGRRYFGLADDRHLYGCLQSLFKLHPDYDQVLAGILRRDPRGLLVLIEGQHARWKELLQQRFARAMPDVHDRIVFLPRQNSEDFLHLSGACDVLLDPLHFGSGNTCYEAFTLGQPIVTAPTEFVRTRVTLGLYRKMGVLDCVAGSAEDYVERAVRIGTEPDYRADLQARIREAGNVIYEDIGAVRELEQFFRDAVARACSEDRETNGR